MPFLTVIPYSLTYTWEKRDTGPQTWDGGGHYRDVQTQDSPRLAQKRDTPEYRIGTAALYNTKEEVTHDD